MSRNLIEAFYDSDEGIAWGPYSAKEMKDDLRRPRPKPKHRRTVFKIPGKDHRPCNDPSSSSNDTIASTASECEKENLPTICNGTVTTYYTANDDSVITISSDEDDKPGQHIDVKHEMKSSLNGNTASFSDSINLDLSTSSIGSYGNEPCIVNLETSTDEDEPKQSRLSTLPVNHTKLTPEKCFIPKTNVTSSKTTPQVVKVPEVVSDEKPGQHIDVEHDMNASLNGTTASFSDSINFDLSPNTSSSFDGSYGNESLNVDLETSTDEDEPKQTQLSTLPVNHTKLTPEKCFIAKMKVTPSKTTPQVFKVPEVVSGRKVKASDKFKDVISPVGLYIKHSPMAHLKQNVIAHPVRSPLPVTKTSPSVNKKTEKLDNCGMLPPILYKPSGKKLVNIKSKNLFMPPSLGKHVINPLVVKHEKKLNVREVSRLTEKLDLDESSFCSGADVTDDCVNMSVLCIKKNFN